MARTEARLTDGTRITDYISLGVVARTFPKAKVEAVLRRTGKTSERQRDLPAHVVVYYVIALSLYRHTSCREVLRCLLEGNQWLTDQAVEPKVAGESGISRARIRLGLEPLRQLHDEIVRPIATEGTPGAWFREWRIVSIDGSTLDVTDAVENAAAFGFPGSPPSDTSFPKIRFVSLCEIGTHVLFGSRMGSYEVDEATLAEEVLPLLQPGMLCLAGRGLNCFRLWKLAQETGAELVWRLRKDLLLPREKYLEDGSFLSTFYESPESRRKSRNGIQVRVVEYTLKGHQNAEAIYRLATTILDPNQAPAKELAALYHERWRIGSAFEELKTHLRGRQVVLRSRTPDLIRQEFYGFMMAHFAIRGLMHEAALKGEVDSGPLSFLHAVRVIRRKMARFASPPARKRLPSHENVLQDLLIESVG